MVRIADNKVIREFFIENGLLAAAAADLYEVEALSQTTLTTIILYNTDAANTNTVTLYIEPAAGGVARAILLEDLLPYERLESRGEPLKLNEGDTLRGDATNANEVVWSISGIKEHSVS